jgi:hypothetical protein
MDIGEVLRRVWQITWKFKGLWILGILAGCGAGGGGGGSTPGSGPGVRFGFGGRDFPRLEHFFRQIDPNIAAFVGIALACLAIFLVIVLFLLGVIGQSGLISGFDLADEGHAVTLSVAFQRGLHYFWKILGAQVLLWLLAALVFGILLIAGGVLTLGTLGLALLCLVPLIIPLAFLFVAVALLFGVYVMLTQVALVVEELDLGAAFSRSWQVMRDNPGNVILLGIVLVIGGAVVGFLLFLPFVGVAAPTLAGVAIGGERATAAGIALSIIGALFLLPLVVLANGIIQTFVTGTWTIAYRRMIGRSGTEKIA